jgi:hypothetical protein
VHFQEASTGGLTWFYAVIFGTFGINLVNIRWTLFAGAVVAVIVLYAILGRVLGSLGAVLPSRSAGDLRTTSPDCSCGGCSCAPWSASGRSSATSRPPRFNTLPWQG